MYIKNESDIPRILSNETAGEGLCPRTNGCTFSHSKSVSYKVSDQLFSVNNNITLIINYIRFNLVQRI